MDKKQFRIPLESPLPAVAGICAIIALLCKIVVVYIENGRFEFYNLFSYLYYYLRYGHFIQTLPSLIPLLFLIAFIVMIFIFAKKNIKLLIIPIVLITLFSANGFFYSYSIVISACHLLIGLAFILTVSHILPNKMILAGLCGAAIILLIGLSLTGNLPFAIEDSLNLSGLLSMVAYLAGIGILTLALDDDPSREYNGKPGGYRYPETNPGMNCSYGGSWQAGVPAELLEVKDIAVCIILDLVTFGIYGLVWLYSLCKKIKLLNSEAPECAGEFLCLIFVPFYQLYWVYSRGKKLADAAAGRNVRISDNSTVYLVLALFGLSIVDYAMMQDSLNAVARHLQGVPAAEAPQFNAGSSAQDMPAAAPGAYAYTCAYTPAASGKDPVQLIRELSDLKNQGIISEAEFEAKKRDLLSKI